VGEVKARGKEAGEKRERSFTLRMKAHFHHLKPSKERDTREGEEESQEKKASGRRTTILMVQ